MIRKTLFAVIFITVLFVPIWAQTQANFNVTLTEDGQGVIITRYTGTVSAVRIPAIIQGMPVREIGDGTPITPLGGPRINSIVMPEGVTRINANAFSGIVTLTAINMPDSLTYIGEQAFSNTGFTAITWPAHLPTINRGMFSGSRNLRTILISEGVTVIQSFAFQNTGLTTLTLPSSIREIQNNAFADCAALASITIPATVERINFGEAVFVNNPRLILGAQAALRRVGYSGGF